MPDAVAPHITDDLHLLTDAVFDAGKLALDYIKAGVQCWEKEPGQPVSDADMAVDALLKEALCSQRPDYGWRSEETAANAARCPSGTTWIIDPIDGTRAFINGRDDWGVSAALIRSGAPVIAAFYAPARQQFFVASHKGGAYCNGEKLSVSDKIYTLEEALMTGDASAFKASPFWPVGWPSGMATIAANSIALRLCMIARSEADCCVTLRPKHDWDMAAADLILREAGGETATGHGDALIFDQTPPLFDHIVAGRPALMPALMARVRPALEQRERTRKETPGTNRSGTNR